MWKKKKRHATTRPLRNASSAASFALLLNVLDASAGAIVVVVELVERSEIPTEAQGKTLCVCDQVPEARRLSSSAFLIWEWCDRLFNAAIISWRVREACDPVTLLVGVPG